MTQYDSAKMHNHPLIRKFTEIIFVDTHERFLELLEEKLIEISTTICSSAKKISTVANYQTLSNYQDQIVCLQERKQYLNDLEKKLEDDISIQIVNLLNQSGFDASHEEYHLGHVDIVVKSKNHKFKWLGEAKLYGGNKYSEKGLYQLINDYSLGNPNESGGVLIYINSTQYKVTQILAQWQEYLENLSEDKKNRLENLSCTYNADYPLVFFSEHEHHRTGLKYKIRHCCLDIRIDF